MRVGVPKETAQGEQRVALIPDAIARLAGFSVAVEQGAGSAAGFPDAAYTEAGAEVVANAWDGVDAVVKVAPPTPAEEERLRSGEVLVSFLSPLSEKERVERLRQR